MVQYPLAPGFWAAGMRERAALVGAPSPRARFIPGDSGERLACEVIIGG
ncbi:hypothetical protein ACWDA3_27620 [Nonomuraea rubra]